MSHFRKQIFEEGIEAVRIGLIDAEFNGAPKGFEPLTPALQER